MAKIKTRWVMREETSQGSFFMGEVVLFVPVKKYNQGTPMEFDAATPSKRQIMRALGLQGTRNVDIQGDDLHIDVWVGDTCVNTMYCSSHTSLSPIKTL